jgi:hypothetical protein
MPRSSKKPSSGPERRVHARVALVVEVGFRSDAGQGHGHTSGVSVGGLSVITAVAPPVGSTIELELWLPGDDLPHQVSGIVRWTGPADDGGPLAGFGVEWTSITTRTLSRIAAIVGDAEMRRTG